jgi:hypothetical protein
VCSRLHHTLVYQNDSQKRHPPLFCHYQTARFERTTGKKSANQSQRAVQARSVYRINDVDRNLTMRTNMQTKNYEKILKFIENDDAEFIYNALNIDNFSSLSQSRLRFFYSHIRNNHLKIAGDIFEFGVFQGSSLIAIAMLLKSVDSKKKIYGFDSFAGFPNYHDYDGLDNFESKHNLKFSQSIIRRQKILRFLKENSLNTEVNVKNISTSMNFSNTSHNLLKSKIDMLGLDNIVLVEGDFKKTIPLFFHNNKISIFSANIDCDLYEGYEISLPFIWDNLEVGGYVHLDEYYSLKFPGARIACDNFFEKMQIKPQSQKNIRPGEFERFYITKDNKRLI